MGNRKELSSVLGWKVSGRIPGLGKGCKTVPCYQEQGSQEVIVGHGYAKSMIWTENVLHKEEDAICFTYIQGNGTVPVPIRSFSKGVVSISHDLENNVLVKDPNSSSTKWSGYWQLSIFIYSVEWEDHANENKNKPWQ